MPTTTGGATVTTTLTDILTALTLRITPPWTTRGENGRTMPIRRPVLPLRRRRPFRLVMITPRMSITTEDRFRPTANAVVDTVTTTITPTP